MPKGKNNRRFRRRRNAGQHAVYSCSFSIAKNPLDFQTTTLGIDHTRPFRVISATVRLLCDGNCVIQCVLGGPTHPVTESIPYPVSPTAARTVRLRAPPSTDFYLDPDAFEAVQIKQIVHSAADIAKLTGTVTVSVQYKNADSKVFTAAEFGSSPSFEMC